MAQNDKKLRRSASEKVVAGVLGGLAEFFGLDVTLVRLLYVLVSIFTAGISGLFVYAIMWIVIPVEGSADTNYQN